jgi:hypothetical protein
MQNNQDTNTMTLVSSKDFRTGVMPRAQLSMQASKLAVDKAVQKDTKEFAGWELMEAIAVINVLKDAGTPVSPMGEEGRAFLEKLKGLEVVPMRSLMVVRRKPGMLRKNWMNFGSLSRRNNRNRRSNG